MNLSEVQVSGEALRHNVAALRGLIQGDRVKLAVVVKGNAYGHGLAEVVRALDGQVDYFQVDDIEELREVRIHSKTPVLVFGYVAKAHVREAISLGGELALYDTERLSELAGGRVHLKIDARLGRQGVLPDEITQMLDALGAHSEVRLAGVYGHYANIEDTTDLTHALAQQETFDLVYAEVAKRHPSVPRHLSATSGLMTVESGSNDIVRLGIGVYGLYPSGPLSRSHEALGLRPALRWVSHLAQVKTLPPGHPVGYGLTFFTSREMRIGIVPQGYADGYDRGLSNSGEVLVGGHRCRVLGRVAMNMFAVDLSGVPDARAEDEVVLLGSQGAETISAEGVAARIGTINYEVVTRVSPLLPRTPI